MIKKNNAYSMVEMLITLVILGIMILTVGAISQVSQSSHYKQRLELDAINDVNYGFKLITYDIRSASSISPLVAQTGNWRGNHIELVNGGLTVAFGVYRTNNVRDFVFIPDMTKDITNSNNRSIILSVPDTADSSTNLSFVPTYDAVNSPNKMIVEVSGTKDKLPFDLKATILKRSK